MSKIDARIARQAQYWRKREEENLKNNLKTEKEYDKELRRIYKDMLDACESDINSFYASFASKEGITIADAKKRVRNADIASYERKAERYVKMAQADMNVFGRDYKSAPNAYFYFSDTANEEMRLYNLTMKVNRLEMLKANIGLNLIKGHAEMETFMEDILQGRTEQELERQAGILGKTIRNNAKTANVIVNASFHNATFSQRIWENHSAMKSDLSKLIEQGLIQGKGSHGLAKDLRKYFIGEPSLKNGKNGAIYASERLMRTELARVQTAAQVKSFEENGFAKFMFIVNSGCCELCRQIAAKNNGVYTLKDLQVGLNAPPVHPFCRCSIAAYEDREEYDDWLTYLESGGTTENWNKMSKTEQKLAIGKVSKSVLKQTIDEDEKKVRSLEKEVAEIDKKIKKHDTKEFDEVKGLTKDDILNEYIAADKRLAEVEPLLEKWYNRPQRGTPEYDEWKAWKKTVDADALIDEQYELTDKKIKLVGQLNKLEQYEEWQKWAKENPLKQLKEDKATKESDIRRLKTVIEDLKKQLAGVPMDATKFLENKKKLDKHEIDDCYNTTNPKYRTDHAYRINCQRCVNVYEARRRGVDVTAAKNLENDDLPYMTRTRGWANVYENGRDSLENITGRTGLMVRKAIRQRMEEWGDGARAIIRVRWARGSGGHVFIAEQVDGNTQFVDPQPGNRDAASYFEAGMIKPNDTYILRIDDKEFTELIRDCVE